MGVRSRMYLLLTTVLFAVLFATSALAEPPRSGRLVTLDNKEILFDGITNRTQVKGWLEGSAISVSFDKLAEITFVETPKNDYSIIGNNIETGILLLTNRADGKMFVLRDAFLPSDCNCSYLTYTYRNPFTGEVMQANAAIEGLQKIIFAGSPR